MKGSKWALALAVLLLGAKGAGLLPQAREPEERKLVTALAVDGGEEVRVTAVTGVRVTEEEEAEVLTGVGPSLAQACRSLRGRSSRRSYLGQTEQLLLGEGEDLAETLDFVLSDRELRLDTLLYIIRGDAGEALAASVKKVAGETGGRDPRGRTVGEILPRLAQGEYALAPALAPGEEGALEPAGWAVLDGGGVAGYLEGDAALGAALLAGLGTGQAVTLPTGAVELLVARTWAVDGTLRCTLTARGVEGEPKKEDLAAWGERCLRLALAPGWDCWGLGRQELLLGPLRWGEGEGTPLGDVEIKVTGKLVES